MHDFYKDRDIKQLQKVMFREAHFPRVKLAPNLANDEFTRGNVELVPIREIVGRTPPRARCHIRPGSCVLFPARSGAPNNVTTSSLWKRASTCYPASPRNYRASTC